MTNHRSNKCLYKASFKEFIDENPDAILGKLHDAFHGQSLTTTNDAWKGEIDIMQQVLIPWKDEDAEIIFEYDIPRLMKRIDVVLLLRGMIFCVEFKVGKKDALQENVDQVMDYALDLKNFHRFSHDRIIVPILVPTNYPGATNSYSPGAYDASVLNPIITGEAHLQEVIRNVIEYCNATEPGTIENWVISPYTPTPTIIEAARALYENHTVEDITRHEADQAQTDATIKYILDVVQKTKANQEKSICFVTGVPGAGKTLVGLDVAVKQTYKDDEAGSDEGAVYLSGNGPLVAVLQEALARDNCQKAAEKGEKRNITDSRREVKKFIQNIHSYRDSMLSKIKKDVQNGVLEFDPDEAVKVENNGYAEVEHIAIFDEAQRAWTHKRIADYLKRGGTYGNKTRVQNFPMSEAAFLIWSLDQREDWANIICLVGGGQEIHTGEAGISEWIAALNERFPKWKVYISDKLTDAEYADGKVKDLLKDNQNVTYSDSLHLGVSMRSFRAEKLSAFVHSLLDVDMDASELYQNVISNNYPIVLTRSMDKARSWLRTMAGNSNSRTGLLISKVAARYKPHAVHVLPPGNENAIHWFLEDKFDVRSSYYLEEAATEIQVQGLELDFTCVLWDADMRFENGQWSFWKFNNKNAWIPERNTETQKYMLNAYRVLLTRARQGMVICIPEGSYEKTREGFPVDSTRLPEYYDSTYEYFKSLGIKEI